MKSYQLHSAPAILVRFPTFRKRLEEEKLSAAQRQQPLSQVFLGGDLEKAGVCLAGAIGLQEPLALITLTREEACHLVADILRLGFEVHVALEACGFGWVFPEQLRAAGAKSVLTLATEPLTGKRKTNRRDAAALCRRLVPRRRRPHRPW